ncbi:MAG: FtsX-like permease family protein [Chthonomonadales bacterium]|nr:FtsX-like permease family protein [Chthonomonadales bacterium]
MSRLHLKLLRDLRAAIWQFAAIGLVASLGVAVFQGSLIAYLNQSASYRLSYARMRFADVTVAMRRAPRSVVQSIARMPGVRAVEGRIVQDVVVQQDPWRRARVVGRLITVPTGRDPAVNRVLLLQGRRLSATPRREVLLEASFARANGYRPGDRICPEFGGRRVAFRVVGIVASPEYIYPVPSKQALVPLPDTFGVMFVHQAQVESLLGLAGSINEVVVLATPGRAEEVGRAIDRRLRPWGSQEPVTRAEQPSNKLLQSDLKGFQPFIVTMPCLFLGTAGLAVSLVLARWVQAQRGQIGFLRASGYSARAVLLHYVEAGLLVGLAGGALGALEGLALTSWMNALYESLLHMPYVAREAHPAVALGAFALSLAVCAAGAFGPARQAASVPPAEAMRGTLPAAGSLLPRLRLPLMLALPARNVLRRPLRALGTALGVASATVLLVVAGSFMDSLDEMLRVFLHDITRYDLLVAFVPERSQSTVAYIATWAGVLRAEPSLDVAVIADHDGTTEETVLTGVPEASRLRRLVTESGSPLPLVPGTLALAHGSASRLGARPGSVLDVRYVQNTHAYHASAKLRVGPLVNQPVGSPLYVRLDEVQRRFAAPLGLPPDAVSGALLATDPLRRAAIQRRLQRMEGVAMVQAREDLTGQIEELTAVSRSIIWAMWLFGLAMAFAVVFAATDAALWERTRELATLRTLGFGMGRLAALVTTENLGVALAGTLGGMWAGTQLARAMMAMQQTDAFSMQLTVSVRTYLLAALGALGVVFVAQWPGLRRIGRLNLASATRTREE